MTLPPGQRPMFTCVYLDGTKKVGTYADTLLWFNEARETGNPCVVKAPHQEYTSP